MLHIASPICDTSHVGRVLLHLDRMSFGDSAEQNNVIHTGSFLQMKHNMFNFLHMYNIWVPSTRCTTRRQEHGGGHEHRIYGSLYAYTPTFAITFYKLPALTSPVGCIYSSM